VRRSASPWKRACGVLTVVFVAAVLFSSARAFAAEAVTESLAPESVSTTGWPVVTMRVVLGADTLASTLSSSDFVVRENGAVVTSVTARPLESVRRPLDVLVLIDASRSMEGKRLQDAKDAAKAFVAALGSDDRVSVMRFSDQPSVGTSFTTDRAAITAAIDALAAGGATSLYDALAEAAGSFGDPARSDRAVVLLSDGGDTTSRNTLESAAAALASASARLYAIAVSSVDTRVTPLRALARSTGGRLVEVTDTNGLTSVFGQIAQQITRPYEVTFTSLRPPAKDLEIDLVVTGRDGRTTVSAAVPNPDMLAAMARVPLPAAPLPASGWPAGIAIAVFLAVGAITAAFVLLFRPESNAIGQLKYYEQTSGKAPASVGQSEYADPRSARGRVVAVMGSVVSRGGFDAVIRRELERAGLPLRPAEYMTLHAAAVLITGLIVQLLLSNVVVTAFAVLVLALGPILALSRLGRKRCEAFQAQLPDVLNLLAGSMRAGWGLLQAAGMVVNEMGAPAGPEFERVVTEARLGLPLEDALNKMADRMGSDDFKWAVTAISIQREVGGNLAEVLDLVAETVRERAALRRQVKSLTAEGRLSGIILTALPFLEGGAMWMLNRAYFSRLFSSPAGVSAVIVACLLLAVGIVWLRQITRVEV
jgi:tight adherence protein B